MAFFDSPKNRALWDKELAELRKQKELRAQGLDPTVTQGKMAEKARQASEQLTYEVNSMRERTSYKELLAEEAASVKKAVKNKDMQKENTNEFKVDLHIKGEVLAGRK